MFINEYILKDVTFQSSALILFVKCHAWYSFSWIFVYPYIILEHLSA